VGRSVDGSPLKEPEHLTRLERDQTVDELVE
jgi:hypothetical protein